MYELLPGFIICLAAAVIVSMLDKNKDPDMLREFDEYKKGN